MINKIIEKIPKKPNKLSLYKRITAKLNTYNKNFKKFRKTDDCSSTMEMVYDIILMGVLINLGATLFGFNLSIIKILGFGCAYWVFTNKIKDLIVDIIISFQPFKVYR